jgi:competence protein ComEC
MAGPSVDLRPVALGSAAWAAAWAATSGDPVWWCAAAAAVVVALGWGLTRRSRFALALALLLAAGLGSGVLRVWQLADGPVGALAREGAVVEADVVLRGSARLFPATATRPAAWVSAASLVRATGRGVNWASGVPIELSASGDQVKAWQSLAQGTTVRVDVRLSVPDPDAGLAALARARESPLVVAPPGPLDAAVNRVRVGLRQASAGLPPDARALVPALVLGDTSSMDPDLVARFKVTGLTHLTAVSGANLVLLLVFVRGAAVRLGVRGRWLNGVLAGTVFGFVALCLAEPSVVRAAAMGLVGLVAVGSGGRGRQGLRYLSVAVLALVFWDPWIARSLGFVLSVAASAGLLVWAGRWTAAMARWAPAWLAETVAVPLAAQLATQPIVTAISGQVSLVGLLANAVAAPLVGPATVCGFLAAGLSVVWLPAASVFAWLAGWCALGLCWIARLGDALPGAAAPWPTTWWAIGLVGAVCWLVALLMPHLLARRWLTLGCAILLLAALMRTPTPSGWPPATWTIVSCDVGQGDATVIRAGPGEAIVVDAGPDPVLLRRCLDQLGVDRVPLVVCTHLHADHVSGLPSLVGRGVRVVVTSGVRTPASGEALVDGLVAAGAEHATAVAGSAWSVGSARLEVLAAEPLPPATDAAEGAEGESSAENGASLLLRVTADGLTVLLAGDTESTGQERLLRLGSLVDVDVLLVPHHGSSRQTPAFLASTTPQVALISVGAKNDYGHPTKKTLALVGQLTPNVVRTDLHGAIAVAEVDGHLVVTTQK